MATFVFKTNRPGADEIALAATTEAGAIAEAEASLPANRDCWARISYKLLGIAWPGLVVPAAWNVTFPPHGNHQSWVEQI
jgi:hypothetical protein